MDPNTIWSREPFLFGPTEGIRIRNTGSKMHPSQPTVEGENVPKLSEAISAVFMRYKKREIGHFKLFLGLGRISSKLGPNCSSFDTPPS